MMTRQQAYERTVRVNSQKTLIDMKIKALETTINKAISDGLFTTFFNIDSSSIPYNSIIEVLEAKNFTWQTSKMSCGLYISWSSDQ